MTGWIAHIIRGIAAVESHFKEEARRKEKRIYNMQTVNGNEQR